MLWLPEEEIYLQDLSRLCQTLSGKYKVYHELYKRRDARFKIPSIIISSITGLTSFGTSNFPPDYIHWVSISVGIASLFIALLNSIEAYMKIGEITAGCIIASINLQKLKEHIDIELFIPVESRSSKGIDFLRDCHIRYEKIIDNSPTILKTVRFVKPSFDDRIPQYISVVSNDTSSTPTPVIIKPPVVPQPNPPPCVLPSTKTPSSERV